MIFLPFLFSFLLGSATARHINVQNTKIVGGEETTIESAPYTLQLERDIEGEWMFYCGAVIILEDTVLTAGHCVTRDGSTEGMRFRSGSSVLGNGTLHTVIQYSRHPNFTDLGGYPEDDIAVLQITPSFINSASTDDIDHVLQRPIPGINATVIGWGTTAEDSFDPAPVLRSVTVPIIDQETCIQEYEKVGVYLTEGMICAGLPEGGKDACSGDSGGPLVVDGRLAGLVSMGYGCARPDFAGIYTNIMVYVRWVNEEIEKWANKTVL